MRWVRFVDVFRISWSRYAVCVCGSAGNSRLGIAYVFHVSNYPRATGIDGDRRTRLVVYASCRLRFYVCGSSCARVRAVGDVFIMFRVLSVSENVENGIP